MYALAAMATSWLHYSSVSADFVINTAISETARIERIKETVTSWRTIAVTLTAGYLALLIPWFGYFLTSTGKVLTKPDEAWMLKVFACSEVTLFSIWVIVGPIAEAWAKVSKVADLLLTIKDGNTNGRPGVRA